MLLLIIVYIVSISMIILSIYLRYWRGKRRFNRRNMAGMQEFKSYEHSLRARYLENFVQFMYILLTIFGVILLLAAILDGKDIMRITHW